MKIIEPYVEVPAFDGIQMLRNIEKAGRTCYKSEDKITPSSFIPFIERIMNLGHHSMFEHEKVTARIVCDRGVTHEIVRHRIAAYSQESTRYCNYASGKYDGGITFIQPCWFEGNLSTLTPEQIDVMLMKESMGVIARHPDMIWLRSMKLAEESYLRLIEIGWSAQQARSVLPNSLKTEIVMTYNLREWRHFFTLRAAKAAHPQMQQIAIPLLLLFKQALNPLFNDIEYNQDFNPDNYAEVKWGVEEG